MINRLKTPALLLGLAVMALGTQASAQSIKVPKDFGTIQEAVNSAVAGDTIVVSPGTYVENVSIGAALNGLTIQGKGSVMIDGFMGGPGVTINASSVSLVNLTIRHAGSTGVSAFAAIEGVGSLTGVTLDRVTVINSQDQGMFLVVDGAKVINCKTIGCVGGIEINGAGAEVTKCEVLNDDEQGILVNGAGANITSCTVNLIEDDNGIEVNGNSAIVSRNNVSNTCGNLIEVNGTGSMVDRNKLSNGGDDGISVTGTSPVIQQNDVTTVCGTLIDVSGDGALVLKNKVSGCSGTGISVVGDNPGVRQNTVSDTGEDSDGIFVSTMEGGGGVEQNRVSNAFSYGINVRFTEGVISKNQVENCGTEDEGGFFIVGDDNTIENNKATDCDSNGFVILGSNNMLTKNQAKGNTVNGIFIVSDPFMMKGEGLGSSTSNRLTSNTCTDNQGQGCNNQGFGTIIEKNKLQKNRQDITNATSAGATYVDNGGNKFTTGGLTVEPDISSGF